MIEYKITKFNPQNYMGGKYIVNEWTSFSDVGKLFDDGVLTYNSYIHFEQCYINCCIELLQKAGISKLLVVTPEYYAEGVHFPSTLSTEEEIREVIMCCLREKFWAKLEGNNFFIHFGYDYHMYIGTNLSVAVVRETAKKHSLFCEEEESPYGLES